MPRDPSLYRTLDTIIIDEISMVRADAMDMIDQFLRRVRGHPSPFGGVQMILFGDPYQLPPVVREDEEADYLQRTYGGNFFFDTPGYRQARIHKIELDHIYRQSDPIFINVLNQVRVGRQGAPDLAVLNGRCDAALRAGGGRRLFYAHHQQRPRRRDQPGTSGAADHPGPQLSWRR